MKISTFLLLVILFIKIGAFANPVDSCEYYNEVETKLSCGPDAYIEHFAKPYCNAYLTKKDNFTPNGQKVLRNIRSCLQDVLSVVIDDLTCTDLESYGFESHEYCYLKSGFCDLESSDLTQIFWIARNEILNTRIWSAALNVHLACLKNHLKIKD